MGAAQWPSTANRETASAANVLRYQYIDAPGHKIRPWSWNMSLVAEYVPGRGILYVPGQFSDPTPTYVPNDR